MKKILIFLAFTIFLSWCTSDDTLKIDKIADVVEVKEVSIEGKDLTEENQILLDAFIERERGKLEEEFTLLIEEKTKEIQEEADKIIKINSRNAERNADKAISNNEKESIKNSKELLVKEVSKMENEVEESIKKEIIFLTAEVKRLNELKTCK